MIEARAAPVGARERPIQYVASAIVAGSVFLVSPIYASLLPAHVVMMLLIGGWLLARSPKAAIVAISAALIFATYLMVVSVFVPTTDRFAKESFKYMLVIVFVAAMMDFSGLARRALFYMAFLIPIGLAAYVLLSSDPLVYGGRLGIRVAGADEDAMISANTIGLAINVCVATLLGRRSKAVVYLAPVFLVLLYLTLSRGALLSLMLIGAAYFLRSGRMIYVVLFGIVGLFLFIDINTSMLSTLRLDDATGSGRTILYEMMLDEMVANPITFLIGNAPGSVDFEIYAGKTLVSAHNGYLELLYTFGAFGVAALVLFAKKIVGSYKRLPMDALLYAALLASYAISEDMMGAHNLMIMGLMLGIILDATRSAARSRFPYPTVDLRLSRA